MLALLALVFVIEVLLYNVVKPDLYKIPGDLYINKWGLRIYIPFVSTIVISIVLSILANYFLDWKGLVSY
ncbi:DUF2905 domain-containing protein [Candidatus Daviesbacteria bacterium]|nr:DUF2905 domain-containing protein [Candidatus Daviesbacteria bacterium]